MWGLPVRGAAGAARGLRCSGREDGAGHTWPCPLVLFRPEGTRGAREPVLREPRRRGHCRWQAWAVVGKLCIMGRGCSLACEVRGL